MTNDDFQRICQVAADNETTKNFAGAVMGLLRAEFHGEDEIFVVQTPPGVPPITSKSSSVSQDQFEWAGSIKDDGSCASVSAFNKPS